MDYVSVTLIVTVFLTLAFSIINTLADTLDSGYKSLFSGLLLMIGVITFYLLNSFCHLSFTDENLIFKFIFKGSKKIELDKIKGLIYKFHVDAQTKYSWKEIHITNVDGSSVELRKWYFMNFEQLEQELRKRFKILVPSTGLIASDIQVEELEREIDHFDFKTVKKEIMIGLTIGVSVFLLSMVLFVDKNIEYLRSVPICLIGMYFFYTTVKNIFYLRALRANRQQCI
jgi:hypothetical protein